jgi:hypothetical protein
VILALVVGRMPLCGGAGRNRWGVGTQQDVTKFLGDANAALLKLSNAANEAGWVQDTYITVDTQGGSRTRQRGPGERADRFRQAGGAVSG